MLFILTSEPAEAGRSLIAHRLPGKIRGMKSVPESGIGGLPGFVSPPYEISRFRGDDLPEFISPLPVFPRFRGDYPPGFVSPAPVISRFRGDNLPEFVSPLPAFSRFRGIAPKIFSQGQCLCGAASWRGLGVC